jgi:hypothetical protein
VRTDFDKIRSSVLRKNYKARGPRA